MEIVNTWLSLAKVRSIATDLTNMYKGAIIEESVLIDALWAHPLYEDFMWLEVDWGSVGQVTQVHVLVPI